MPTFELDKGSKFQLSKSIRRVKIGLGWSVGEKENLDPDACVFGLSHLPGGVAKFYNDGTHAVFYGNKALKQPDGSFQSPDRSITHTGDNRVGGDGDCEVINVDLSLVPAGIVEIAVWVAIYDAIRRKQTFASMRDAYVKISDIDAGVDLAEYKLGTEFSKSLSVQVGSLVRDDRDHSVWSFEAVGAGAAVELSAVIEQYS